MRKKEPAIFGLRNIYAASGLTVKPKTRVSKIETLKEIIRACGVNPEHVLTREALSQPAAVQTVSTDEENSELQILSKTIHDIISQEALKTTRP